MTRAGERLAAIDVGSNTILLMIADYDPATGLTTIEEAEDQPRLGAGLRSSGRLDERAMERAMASLVRMRDACRRLKVGRLGAVATAAVREARNGTEFVERVRTLEIPLRIISPDTEADLSYRSAAHHFPTSGPMLVADIGGGSLELIAARDGLIQLKQSLPLGAVRLTEMGLTLPELRRHIASELARAMPNADWAGATIIGSGGTFASLGSDGFRGPGSARDAGSRHPRGQLRASGAPYGPCGADAGSAAEIPGLPPERADIIVAGLAVVTELLRRTGSGLVTVSGFGLRDGLLLEMVAR